LSSVSQNEVTVKLFNTDLYLSLLLLYLEGRTLHFGKGIGW